MIVPRRPAGGFLLGCCLHLAASAAKPAEPAVSPNIILILIDDMPWFGTPVRMSPELPGSAMAFRHMPDVEKLAAQGMTFRNARAAAGMCAPARCSIQTGLMTARHLYKKPKAGAATYVYEFPRSVWGGRKAQSGPHVYYNDASELVRDNAASGKTGAHGERHEWPLGDGDAVFAGFAAFDQRTQVAAIGGVAGAAEVVESRREEIEVGGGSVDDSIGRRSRQPAW